MNYSKIFNDIFFPIFQFLFIFMIISCIWCLIFKISFKRYMATVFWPFVNLLFSLAYIIYQLLYLPVIIYEYIKLIIFKIGEILAYVINFFNNITNFMYDTSDDLF